MAVRGQTPGAGDLDGAVTVHLDGVTPLACLVGEDRDHGALDVIAVVLLDLVADLELLSHIRILFANQIRRTVRLNYGISVFGVSARGTPA
jgi:hypothetical protein